MSVAKAPNNRTKLLKRQDFVDNRGVPLSRASWYALRVAWKSTRKASRS